MFIHGKRFSCKGSWQCDNVNLDSLWLFVDSPSFYIPRPSQSVRYSRKLQSTLWPEFYYTKTYLKTLIIMSVQQWIGTILSNKYFFFFYLKFSSFIYKERNNNHYQLMVFTIWGFLGKWWWFLLMHLSGTFLYWLSIAVQFHSSLYRFPHICQQINLCRIHFYIISL